MCALKHRKPVGWTSLKSHSIKRITDRRVSSRFLISWFNKSETGSIKGVYKSIRQTRVLKIGLLGLVGETSFKLVQPIEIGFKRQNLSSTCWLAEDKIFCSNAASPASTASVWFEYECGSEVACKQTNPQQVTSKPRTRYTDIFCREQTHSYR